MLAIQLYCINALKKKIKCKDVKLASVFDYKFSYEAYRYAESWVIWLMRSKMVNFTVPCSLWWLTRSLINHCWIGGSGLMTWQSSCKIAPIRYKLANLIHKTTGILPSQWQGQNSEFYWFLKQLQICDDLQQSHICTLSCTILHLLLTPLRKLLTNMELIIQE